MDINDIINIIIYNIYIFIEDKFNILEIPVGIRIPSFQISKEDLESKTISISHVLLKERFYYRS